MRRFEQETINQICANECSRVALELKVQNFLSVNRLRTCRAYVYETPNYYVLKSYNTYVAFICKTTDTLYDILRYTYGYTPTSAQHISKFKNDYGQDKWGCHQSYRYYPVRK